MPPTPDQIVAAVAAAHLDIATLERRNLDRLDFHEVAVWQVDKALRLMHAHALPPLCVKVRTHPIDVFFLTGEYARKARREAGREVTPLPCFTTSSFGGDGHCWDTPEGFEADYDDTFGGLRTPKRDS